jgi:hypothetical protein
MEVVLTRVGLQAWWPGIFARLAEQGNHLPGDFDLYIVASPLTDSLEKLIILAIARGATAVCLSDALPHLEWSGICQYT